MALPMRFDTKYGLSNMRDKKAGKKLSVRDIVLLGMMVCSLEVGKLALAMIPNVEIVSLMIIVYTVCFGVKTIYAIIVFVLLECVFWGVGLWTIMYLYVWPILGIAAYFFRKIDSKWFWSVFSAIFGLLFGPLCSLTYLVMGGLKVAFGWWIAGIPWDLVHCVANFVVMFVLYSPLVRLLRRFGRFDGEIDKM